MIGLANSGKSALLHSYANKTGELFPTAGFSINYLNVGHKSVLVYDCSGEGHSRPTWSFLYENCNVVIYVIDACDPDRFSIAKQALNRFIDHNKTIK